jgi:uncharacterized protein YggE
MVTIKKIVPAVLILVFMFLGSARAEDKTSPRIISVSGSAEVKVTPDEVILTLGVETFDKDLSVAKTDNDQRVKRVLEVGKEYQVEPKHIQTSYINIQPERRYETMELKGYTVRKLIVFTIKDISKFESILNSALTAGANVVNGIQFRTTELRKYRDQARSLAIKAAQEKADALAKELGQTVGKPRNINETSYSWWSGDNGWWGGSFGRGGMQNVMQNAVSSGASPEGESSISLGQISVSAIVNVSFELE